MNNQTNVVLPAWIFEQAQDKEQLKMLVLNYMRKYPDYTVKRITKRFAVCEINR
ncbi:MULTISPECIES: hypothetical protein [Cytobacillus]|uniref:hypothetical protein n=1 Tax=Cytobacillus TaxID=2675230 RepID=UPI00203B83DB|nr:hypothetical protein [Cytobacillus kochii]MCM3324267.1 hypothetical protein [Cytobacillus kochii]